MNGQARGSDRSPGPVPVRGPGRCRHEASRHRSSRPGRRGTGRTTDPDTLAVPPSLLPSPPAAPPGTTPNAVPPGARRVRTDMRNPPQEPAPPDEPSGKRGKPAPSGRTTNGSVSTDGRGTLSTPSSSRYHDETSTVPRSVLRSCGFRTGWCDGKTQSHSVSAIDRKTSHSPVPHHRTGPVISPPPRDPIRKAREGKSPPEAVTGPEREKGSTLREVPNPFPVSIRSDRNTVFRHRSGPGIRATSTDTVQDHAICGCRTTLV